MFDHPQSKETFPNSQSEPPLLQLYVVPTSTAWRLPVFSLLRELQRATKFSLLVSSRLEENYFRRKLPSTKSLHMYWMVFTTAYVCCNLQNSNTTKLKRINWTKPVNTCSCKCTHFNFQLAIKLCIQKWLVTGNLWDTQGINYTLFPPVLFKTWGNSKFENLSLSSYSELVAKSERRNNKATDLTPLGFQALQHYL